MREPFSITHGTTLFIFRELSNSTIKLLYCNTIGIFYDICTLYTIYPQGEKLFRLGNACYFQLCYFINLFSIFHLYLSLLCSYTYLFRISALLSIYLWSSGGTLCNYNTIFAPLGLYNYEPPGGEHRLSIFLSALSSFSCCLS